jgi:hypothetical protein
MSHEGGRVRGSTGTSVDVAGGLPFVAPLQPLPSTQRTQRTSDRFCCSCFFRRRVLATQPTHGEDLGRSSRRVVANALRQAVSSPEGAGQAPLPEGAVSATDWILLRRLRSEATLRAAHDAASIRMLQNQSTATHAGRASPLGGSAWSRSGEATTDAPSISGSGGSGRSRSGDLQVGAAVVATRKTSSRDGSNVTAQLAPRPLLLSGGASSGMVVPPSPRTPGRTVRRIGRDADAFDPQNSHLQSLPPHQQQIITPPTSPPVNRLDSLQRQVSASQNNEAPHASPISTLEPAALHPSPRDAAILPPPPPPRLGMSMASVVPPPPPPRAMF